MQYTIQGRERQNQRTQRWVYWAIYWTAGQQQCRQVETSKDEHGNNRLNDTRVLIFADWWWCTHTFPCFTGTSHRHNGFYAVLYALSPFPISNPNPLFVCLFHLRFTMLQNWYNEQVHYESIFQNMCLSYSELLWCTYNK